MIGTASILSGPAIADVLVVRANGPSAGHFVVGKTLSDRTRIVLAKGDQLVLLDAKGTRTLSGPGSFMATGGPSAAAPSALLALAGNTAQRRERVGAVRGFPTTRNIRRPNIFFVDTQAPGAMCVADPHTVELWRAKSDSGSATTLTGADGTTASITWTKGQSTQAWPAALPIATGRSYRLADEAGTTSQIQFRVLAAMPTDLPTLAEGLIKQGCQGQIDVLIATTGTQ